MIRSVENSAEAIILLSKAHRLFKHNSGLDLSALPLLYGKDLIRLVLIEAKNRQHGNCLLDRSTSGSQLELFLRC